VTPRVIALIVLAVTYLVIVAQNTAATSFQLFFWEISLPRVILMTLMALFGFVVGYAVGKLGHSRGEGAEP